MHGATVKIR